jgi:flagellin
MLDEVNSISNNTQFNTRNLLSQNNEIGLQTGANSGQRLNFNMSAINTDTLGLSSFADVFGRASVDNVQLGGTILSSLVSELDSAISAVTGARAELGAIENRLEHTSNNLMVSSNNASAAHSRIRDADLARESINMHQQNIQEQATLAMMAHSNMQMGAVARLLG